jgi:hypothetical protein
VASLTLLRQPRKMFADATESLFLCKAMGNRRAIAQKFVFEALPCERLRACDCELPIEEGWMRGTASYSTDLISLCQLCHCVNPRRISLLEPSADTPRCIWP